MELPKIPSIPFLRVHLDDLWTYLKRSKLVVGPGLKLREEGNSGMLLELETSSGSSSSSSCSFGKIKTWSESGATKKGVTGGNILCGDKNYFVDDLEIPFNADGSGDGQWLVEILLSGITANLDDDEELILGGIKTSTGTPSWNLIPYTGSENYTSNTNFTTPASEATLAVPIGRVTVEGDLVTIESSGCGWIFASQCNGVLSYSRGGANDLSYLESMISDHEARISALENP